MKKMWTSLPITKKLMLVTIPVFLFFCLAIFLGQIAFFEKYYTHVKTTEVQRAADEFSKIYQKQSDEEEIRTRIAEISDEYGCYMMVIEKSGAMKYMLSYYMVVTAENGEDVVISLDSAVYDSDFQKLNLAEGDKVEVGYFADNPSPDKTMFPFFIKKDSGQWNMNRKDRMYQPENKPDGNNRNGAKDNFVTAEGVVSALVLPSEQARNISAERGSAFKAVGEWISRLSTEQTPDPGESIAYFYVDDQTMEKFTVTVLTVMGKENDMVFAIAPLAMVSEAAEVTRNTFFFWFLIAMAAACGLGILFSKVLTRPIIDITAVTKKMAALDFGSRCEYSSNDEIGELAANINILSQTLDQTINELQKANEKLLADIEHERAVEMSRREFVAAASHELKTPLGIIRAYTEALTDGVSENKRNRYMQVIIEETEKMDRLILDMLENSKLESGAQKLNISSYDVGVLLKGVFRRFADVMAENNIDAECRLPDYTLTKKFDCDMIERVLTNFITNAIKHTPKGGKIICAAKKNDDGTVSVSVENSGAAISPEDLEHVWDRFYKADKSRKRSEGGTGLGLSIAKNILTLHKAEYSVKNTEIGVCFSFTLK